MSGSYSKWSDVKAAGRALDPRTGEEQAAGKAAAGERREAYVRGHQLAEMRTTAGVTQARSPASMSCAPTSPHSAEVSTSSPGLETGPGR
jgi:hypothetical protein